MDLVVSEHYYIVINHQDYGIQFLQEMAIHDGKCHFDRCMINSCNNLERSQEEINDILCKQITVRRNNWGGHNHDDQVLKS